jgi:predicted amidohydrolase YtcJ
VKLLALSLTLATFSAVAQSPDTLYFHGNILTGAHLRADDKSATPAHVTALAIRAGKIVAIGTDQQILALKGPRTNAIDLKGAFAMPGFNDAHTHIAYAGQQHLSVDLDNVPTLAAMQAKIHSYAANLTPGQWIVGGGWDHTKWASNKLPTRQDLDVVTGDHPAYLQRTDGHIAVVNTAALKAANITGATKAPQGSQIDLDVAGNPTGIIREDAARALIEAHIPKPDAAARRKALQLAIDDALSHSVTSVQDFSDWDDFLVLEQMGRDHKLNLRISEWLTFNDSIDVLKQHRAAHPLDDPLLHTGMLKGFMDGSLGSRTAAMLAPYSDDPTNSGLPRYNQAKLDAMTKERAAAGFQIGFHAIGDRANTMALNAFTQARPNAASRDRIEHAQVLASSDFERFHKLGIIASMQPSHLLTDMAWAPARLGPERSKYAYAWKAFLDHGVTLAFGTDYPVESISPFRGLYSAVTRMNEAGTQTFQPQEKLTIQQAIYAYTQGSAFAENEEKLKGRLETGYFADIAVLDRDLITATPREILNAKVLRTIVGGETVYLAK